MKNKNHLVPVTTRESLEKHIALLFEMLADYPTALTLEQVQEILNIKEKQTYNKIHSGELPALWIGNSYRVLKTELIIYIAMQTLDISALEGEHEGGKSA